MISIPTATIDLLMWQNNAEGQTASLVGAELTRGRPPDPVPFFARRKTILTRDPLLG